MAKSVLREALWWSLPLLMTGMMAAAMGMLVYLVVAEAGMTDPGLAVLSLLVTFVMWAWSMRLVVQRRNGGKLAIGR